MRVVGTYLRRLWTPIVVDLCVYELMKYVLGGLSSWRMNRRRDQAELSCLRRRVVKSLALTALIKAMEALF